MAYYQDQATGDIIINGFDKGIADDPYEGIANLVNVNVTSIPKEASVNFSTAAISPPVMAAGSVSSANSSTHYLTYTGAPLLENLMTIVFSAESGLNVSTGVAYWVTNLGGAGAGTFQITSDYAQTSVVSVTNGTGTFSVAQVTIEPITGSGSGVPQYFTYDAPDSAYFMLTTAGALWSNIQTTTSGYWTFCGDSGTAQTNQGCGLGYYQSFDGKNSYVFVFRNQTIDYFLIKTSGNFDFDWVFGWNPLNGSGSNSQATLISAGAALNTNTTNHNTYYNPANNTLYWCDGNFLGSLFETPNGPPQTSEFDPTVVGGVTGFALTFGGTSGYSNHTNVTTSGGTGSGATVNTTTAGGIITSITIHTEGSGYAVGDTITITGGSGDATFEVLTIGSYTYTKQALEIPNQDQAQCIVNNQANLLIGGKNNYIYVWDTNSPNFNYPIPLAEYNTTSMVTVSTNTFIFCGNKGRIYLTNGSQAQVYKKIPDFLSGTVEPYFQWGGTCSFKNHLFFSFAVTQNNVNAGFLSTMGGLWGIDMTVSALGTPANNALRLVQTLSYQTTTYNGFSTALIPNFGADPAGTGLYIAWDNNAGLRGIDTTTYSPYAGANAVSVGIVDSDLIPIGTFLKPTTTGRVEFKLSVPLVSGESVQLFYRQNFATSFAQVGNAITSSTQGFSGFSWAYTNIPFESSQWIQLRAVLTSIANPVIPPFTNPSYVRLSEMRLGN